jgi:hypothetical protein
MHDYEIRDVMRRDATPSLSLGLTIGPDTVRQLRFQSGDGRSDPIPLIFSLSNSSPQPAVHVIITIGIDSRLIISSTGDYEGPLKKQGDGSLTHFKLLIGPPVWLPIFKEAPLDAISKREFHVRFSAEPSIPKAFRLTAKIQCPGFVLSQDWTLVDEDKWVHLHEGSVT